MECVSIIMCVTYLPGVDFRTALHWAAKRGHAGVTEFLVNNGADRSIKTNTGKTALHLATNESVRTLLKGKPVGVKR